MEVDRFEYVGLEGGIILKRILKTQLKGYGLRLFLSSGQGQYLDFCE
jgi:hypothetical protein